MTRKIEYIESPRGENLELIRELFQEYAKSLGIDLSFQNFSEELKELPNNYSPPTGFLILVKVDGKAAGSIALRSINEKICEMKRLYVRDDYRNLGLGSKLIQKIIIRAKELGYDYMRLDTLPSMVKAQNLYRSYGFYEIDPYIYNPIEGTCYMELKL